MNRIIFITLCLLYSLVYSQDCTQLPNSFKSYSEASSLIGKTKFAYSYSRNTSKSSWIRSATFKSCDGKTGFLIIGTDSHLYVHQNVPFSLWQSFTRTSFFGSFYNKFLRNRYTYL